VDRVTPPLPLRTEEALLLASLAWLLAAAGAGAWLLRRRNGAAGLAAAGLLAGLTLATLAWHSTRAPETLIVLRPAPLLAGPSLQAERLGELQPGAALIPVTTRPGWVRARTATGAEGWTEAVLLAPIGAP
jgi:hypothetical protein